MKSNAATVETYLASLPEDRRKIVDALRKVIRENLDPAFEEGMQYGALGYFLPHARYPDGYHCDPKQPLPFAGIASQKNHVGLYLFCIYASEEDQAAFRRDWLASGKKLDMGKSCVRVKKLEDIPLDVVGRTFARITAKKFVASYERNLQAAGRREKAQPVPRRAKALSQTRRSLGTTEKTATRRAAKPKARRGKAAGRKR